MHVHYIQRLGIVFMLLLALIGGSWAASQPPAAEAVTGGVTVSVTGYDCTAPGSVSLHITGDFSDNDGGSGTDYIRIVASPSEGAPPYGDQPGWPDTGDTAYDHTLPFDVSTPTTNPVRIFVYESTSPGSSTGGPIGSLPWTSPCIGGGTGVGGSAPVVPAEKKVGPGPDMIPIPAGGAVGTFVADTTLLFAPDMNAWTGLTMKAGQSLWVFGVDESGLFYQVVLAGQKLWVPVAAMAPTHDKYWDGKKLPETTVK